MVRLPIRILLSVFVLLLLIIPLYVTTRIKAAHVNSTLVRGAFSLGCVLWGVRVKTEGMISKKKPLLLVSNHFSYLDVFALGSVMNMQFTPKSEIASWPVIGFFCKITGCVFIDRRRVETLNNKAILDRMVSEGSIISLFPEGTTNDGASLLPFKSSFFGIAENNDLSIQPVSVIYTKVNGEPVTLANRHLIGWYGDMDFFPHLITFLQQRSVDVTLVFHEVVLGKNFSSRKELAGYCHDKITLPVLL